MKKFLILSGVNSYPGKEKWHKKHRNCMLLLLFFNIVPQLHNVVWKLHEVFTTYNIVIFLNYSIFSRNFADITGLMDEICDKMDAKTKVHVK